MGKDEKSDWLLICGKCGFYSDEEIDGRCHYPDNKKYSCLGFRMDGKKTLGIFKSKERRCGEKAIYFKSRTVESIESIK